VLTDIILQVVGMNCMTPTLVTWLLWWVLLLTLVAQEGHLPFWQQCHVSLYHCNPSNGLTPPSYRTSLRPVTTA